MTSREADLQVWSLPACGLGLLLWLPVVMVTSKKERTHVYEMEMEISANYLSCRACCVLSMVFLEN